MKTNGDKKRRSAPRGSAPKSIKTENDNLTPVNVDDRFPTPPKKRKVDDGDVVMEECFTTPGEQKSESKESKETENGIENHGLDAQSARARFLSTMFYPQAVPQGHTEWSWKRVKQVIKQGPYFKEDIFNQL